MRFSFLAAATAALAIGASCGGTGDSISSGAASSTGLFTGAGGGTSSATATASASSVTSGGGGEGGAMPKGPPYPFVLAHGFFGFEKFAGQDFLTYYYKVKDHLAQEGEMVDTPAVDPFNDSTFRGQQLSDAVEKFMKATGASKVNIIGHSQGGLDARVVAHDHPDWVASVVTIATPHQGTPVADVAVKLLADPNAAQIIDALAKLIGAPLYDAIGNETSVTKPLHLFSTPGIAAFNAQYPDALGVFYASIAGRSALHGDNSDCQPDVVLQFISPWKKTVDPINALFSGTTFLLEPASHDGLVRDKDARWGEFWGCVPADHVDEIGQIFGQAPGLGNDWDYLKFYSLLIGYMRQKGF